LSTQQQSYKKSKKGSILHADSKSKTGSIQQNNEEPISNVQRKSITKPAEDDVFSRLWSNKDALQQHRSHL
jgi:hypothetical protein